MRAAACLIAGTLLAQQPAFRTEVPLVVAPTAVTTLDGRYVPGLTASDFLLFDNGQRQSFQLDVEAMPLSLVVAVESSDIAAPALAKIRRIGSMIEPLLIGEPGEAAVMTFDSQLRWLQDFTSSPDRLVTAFRSIAAGGSGSRLTDAVMESVRRLSARPPERRRVLVLIGETRDRSSEGKLEDAVTLAQSRNVTVYAVTFSAFVSGLAAKPSEAAPVTSAGLNLVAILTEISRLAKTNAADALAGYTGGRHLSFLKQRSLERVIAAIGEELHSQYLLSFSPRGRTRGEYREIRVEVPGRPELAVRTRPGYWLPARSE